MRRTLSVCFAVIAVARLAAQSQLAEPVEVRCPSVLGVGIVTNIPFCDVLVQREPTLGILIVLPSHRGEAELSFNLHNRHIYSEEEEHGGRGYAQYLASVAIATIEGELLVQGVVLSEFRSVTDLLDRVTGGAGPTGIKAVAPLGTERVTVVIPSDVKEVFVVGLSLEVTRADGKDTYRAIDRPVAVLSEARLEYHPR